MKRYINTFIISMISISVLTLIGCERHTEAWQKLDIAEGLMESRPDSALLILESIHSGDLRKPSDKALYGLLFTQAMDKNWLNPKNDSLISFAADYYESVNDPQRQAMSNYYQGVVRYNNENYPSAILSFFKAKDISEANESYFYAGMACRGIADIYNKSFNSAEELHYAEKELEHFRRTSRQPYLNYALSDYERSLHNNGNYEKSMDVSMQLLDSATLYKDDYLKHEALRAQALIYIATRKFHDAYPILVKICKSDFSESTDTLRFCEVLFEIDHLDESLDLLRMVSDVDITLKNYIKYKIERRLGNYHESLLKIEYIDSVNNQSFKAAVSHNLTSTLTDYFNIKKAEDQLKIKEANISRNILIVCAIVAILVIVSLFVNYYRMQSRKISEKILLAEQLTESLRRSNTENTKSSDILKSLQSSKYELLDELCSIAYQNNDDNSRRRKVADAVDRLIEDLSSQSEKIDELEKRVDRFQDNLFSDFRNDFPKLKEQDYRLFLFLVLGLEMPTITLLLKESKIEAVYNRKRRLKVKITNLECCNRDKYLSYFN